MLLSYLAAILIGFILLIWGADRFVIGSSATARNLGVSPLVIGLTVVGFGTSAPEMLVSAMAAWNGSPDIGIGNALGSNITNVGLVLGITAIIAPLTVHSQILHREFPILLLVIALALLLLIDDDLTRLDGLTLLGGMVLMVLWLVRIGMQQHTSHNAGIKDPLEEELINEIPTDLTIRQALFWVAVGMVVLLGSSKLLVWGATNLAYLLGVSELIIGLTVVAIGTSLPELAASVASTLKGEYDLAIGNILGSNLFNILGVLGIAGVIQPTILSSEVLERDYPVMAAFSVALFIMAYGFGKPGRLVRMEGVLLLAGYIFYLLALYYSVTAS